MTNEKMAKNLVRYFNIVNGTMIRVNNEKNLAIVCKALEKGNYESLKDYISSRNGSKDFNAVIADYINGVPAVPAEKKVVEKTVEKAVEEEKAPAKVAPAVSKEEIKAEVISEIKAENAIQQLGLLEKVLAQVIVQNQGEAIKAEIMGDYKKEIESYILENYGPIQKKVEIEVAGKKTELDEVLHEKFETVLKFVSVDEPVFLTGQAGTGKNVLCKQVAKALGLDFYFTNAVTQEYKLTGFIDANGTFHETQFYKAFKNGGLFMLDEMDASIPEVLVILNAAIANRYFDFPCGYVEAHPDFRVIAAGNTFGLGADYEYVGRNQLDMASLDRFAMVEIDYDENIEKAVANGDTELVEFVHELRKVSAENCIRMVVSYRGISRLSKMVRQLGLCEALKTCIFKNLRKDDINVLYSAMKKKSNTYICAMELLTA